MLNTLRKTIFLACFIWMAGVILTQPAFGADTVVYAVLVGSQVLGTLDLNTGVFTQISPQVVAESALAAYGGNLYGAGACACLIQINPVTAAVTVAPLTFSNRGNSFGPLNGFGSTTAGVFAIGGGNGDNTLYSIDLVSGNPTPIGPTGVMAGGGTGTLSTSIDSTQLYWETQAGYTDTLYSINTSTGAATLIGAFTFSDPNVKTGNAFSMVYTGGTLWANFYAYGFGTINTSTGAQTLVSTSEHPIFFGMAPYPLTGASGGSPTYYFSDLAFSGGYQTTLSYTNYSPQAVTCVTTFYSDAGTPLAIPFSGGTVSTRTDTLQPGQSLHDQTTSSATPPYVEGWAQASCNGAVEASLLYRLYQGGVPVGEASVNAETSATTEFATFAQTLTGVAYGNPSTTQSAAVTITAYNTAGTQLGSHTISLGPLAHGAVNVGPLLGLASFSGFVKITSTIPIISLSINAEVFPVFSSLPPGDLPGSTALVGSGSNGSASAQTYYFSDLAFGGGYQTTLSYINYSPQAVTCVTNFYSDAGTPLAIPFGGGTVSTRTDTLQPGQSIHDQTISSATPPSVEGWAQASCTGPVEASLLYRLYQGGVPVGEASVNAETSATTEFATFAQTVTGVAYGNPSTTQSASVTMAVYNTAGTKLGSTVFTLGPLAHGSANLGPLLGLSSFSGFVKITSTIPIISLSINAEVFPVFSSLPPGDLPGSTTLIP